MEVGDTVQVTKTGMVGVIVNSVDEAFGCHVDKQIRWVVRLAYTMRRHIFLQKDLEVLSSYPEGGAHNE